MYPFRINREVHNIDRLDEYIGKVNSTCYENLLKGIIGLRNMIDLYQDEKEAESKIVS
jgi:hypothetical protein